MNKKRLGKIAFGLSFGLAASAMAYNPISTYHYLADPGAAADDDYFYIITDSDDPAAHNASGYDIKALYGFRSRDMQNWTDFGIIYDARQVEGIGDIWASGIAVKDGKFYIVFPDGGGGGIGYIKADDIAGPWSNAVGGGKSKLVAGWGNGLIDCDGVSWCFDPSVFIDDDGTSYVTWGGGEGDSRPNTDNFDVVKLNDAKDGISGSPQHVKVDGLPTRKMLEASYIHKHDKKYYFSYSTGWQQGAPTIDYGIGDSPMGPFTWKGTILPDPNIDGRSINGNNNHHGIAEFKGHSYVVYHDRRIANGYDGLEVIPADDGMPNPDPGFHRSVSVDEMFYNADGTIKEVVCTKDGPEQIENFDPYDWYPALTSSKQKGIRSRSNFVPGKVAESYLLPLSSKESWIRVSGVDFGTAATGFRVEAASTAEGNTIEIHKGSADGALAGTCALTKTSSKTDYVETSCEVDGLSGVVDHIFLVFKGSQDSTMAIKAWGFEGSGSTEATPHSPYEGVAAKIPAKIEAEHFDVPGSGRGNNVKSYKDDDSKNQGDAEFRTDLGVDIVLGGSGKAIGYTNEGEWLLYTIEVPADGDYEIKASASTGAESASFKFQVDDKDVGTEVVVAQTGEDWSVYKEFSAGSATLTAGTHVVKLIITGTNVNIDWFSIGDVSAAPADVTPAPGANDSNSTVAPGDSTSVPPESIGKYKVRFDVSSSNIYNVFSMNGKKLGTVDMTGHTAAEALSIAGFGKGVYMLKKVRGNKSFIASTMK